MFKETQTYSFTTTRKIARDQAPHWGKKEKNTGAREKKFGWRIFFLPLVDIFPISPLFFFAFFPHRRAWSQATRKTTRFITKYHPSGDKRKTRPSQIPWRPPLHFEMLWCYYHSNETVLTEPLSRITYFLVILKRILEFLLWKFYHH